MAGSLNHIVTDDGAFRMANIENMRDAREALEECFDVIAALMTTFVARSDQLTQLNATLDALEYPAVKAVPQIGKRSWHDE